jgi:hypothetical protein
VGGNCVDSHSINNDEIFGFINTPTAKRGRGWVGGDTSRVRFHTGKYAELWAVESHSIHDNKLAI